MNEHEFSGPAGCELPEGFPSPFDLAPHPLAQLAARDLQVRLQSISSAEHNFFAPDGGKMFGVLVVQKLDAATDAATGGDSKLAYLAAFSGMLAGRWERKGFAPPVFDLVEREQLLGDGLSRLREIQQEIDTLLQSSERKQLQRKLVALVKQQKQALAQANLQYQSKRQQRHEIRSRLSHEARGTDHSTEYSKEHSIDLPTELDYLTRQSQTDKSEYRALKRSWAQHISNLQSQLDDFDTAIAELKAARKALSGKLQEKLFSGYRLLSYKSRMQGRVNLPPIFSRRACLLVVPVIVHRLNCFNSVINSN